MATELNATTPPPPSSLRTPTTPRFGTFDDDYQPYSSRKSSRVAQRSRSAQTPPPQISGHKLRTSHSTPQSSNGTSSTMDSLPTSPQTASKKRAPQSSLNVGGRRVSGALDYEGTASAAMSLGLPTPSRANKLDVRRSTAAAHNNMLPTPAKTPKKLPNRADSAVKGVARNLFSVHSASVEEAMPSPKKKGRKKYSGFTLDSFGAEDDNEPISIFTDSHDRVPEVDTSAGNPFYGESANIPAEPTKRVSKRRKVTVPGEGEQEFEEVEQREDGLIYVFRGKKVFRKFSDTAGSTGSFGHLNDAEEEVGDEMGDNLDAPSPSQFSGRITRSSVKPRLLFPSAQQLQAKEFKSKAEEDEEADTDIEDLSKIISSPHTRGSRKMATTSTPLDQVDDDVATPKAPRFAPATPPTTTRTTRSKNVATSSPAVPSSEDEGLSMRGGRGRRGKISPFDTWQRVKTDESQGIKKREGEAISRGRGGKRIRS